MTFCGSRKGIINLFETFETKFKIYLKSKMLKAIKRAFQREKTPLKELHPYQLRNQMLNTCN